MKTAFIIIFAVGAVIVLLTALRSKHPFGKIVTSIFQGITSMMAVNVLGLITGVTISVNWYTLLAGAVFGIPSTITILLMDAFLI